MNKSTLALAVAVGVVAQHADGSLIVEQLLDISDLRGPSRHRVEAPVQEDAELRIVVPPRKGMRAH